MFVKLILTVFFLLHNVANGEYDWASDTDDTYDIPPPNPMVKSDNLCNKPICSFPCPMHGPPPYCPVNMTRCTTHCICMDICEDNHRTGRVCFDTKFCSWQRKYLSRKLPLIPPLELPHDVPL